MGDRHGLFGRFFPSKPLSAAASGPAAQIPLSLPVPQRQVGAPFSSFGEKGEQIGEQIAHVFGRISELQQLREDFAAIVKPMNDFIVSHAEAQTRLAETEALLARERRETQVLRGVTGTLRSTAAQLEDEIAALQSQVRVQQEVAEVRESDLKGLKIGADDRDCRKFRVWPGG